MPSTSRHVLALICSLPSFAALAQGGSNNLTVDSLTITGTGSTGDASGFGAKPTGATTGRSLSNLFWNFPVSVAAFGAVGDGVADDAPAINAAIQNRCARGGGTVLLMARHKVGTPLDNYCSRVLVMGYGFETAHDNGTPVGTLITPTFAGDALRHRTRPASELGIAASANTMNTGGGFVGLAVAGNCVATRLLHVTSVRGGTYQITMSGAVGTEAALFDTLPDPRTTTPEVGEASDIQGMNLDLDIRQDASTAGCSTGPVNGVVFDTGAGTGNPSYNEGLKLTGRVYDGVGWVSASSDNNTWQTFRMAALGPNGKPFLIQANTATKVNDNNVFLHYGVNKAGYVEGIGERAGTISAPIGTTIVSLDTTNGTPLPATGAGARLAVLNSYQTWTTWTPTLSAQTGTFSNTIVPEAAYFPGPGNLYTFTLSFLAEHSGASGALRFTLPKVPNRTFEFTGFQANNGWSMTCRTAIGSVVVNCTRFDGGSILQGGNSYYTISGSYEAQ